MKTNSSIPRAAVPRTDGVAAHDISLQTLSFSPADLHLHHITPAQQLSTEARAVPTISPLLLMPPCLAWAQLYATSGLSHPRTITKLQFSRTSTEPHVSAVAEGSITAQPSHLLEMLKLGGAGGTQTATRHLWLPRNKLSQGWPAWWAVGKQGGEVMQALTQPTAGRAVC